MILGIIFVFVGGAVVGKQNRKEDLGMAKKRDHKIMITEEAINKVPRIEYKGIPETEYDNIQKIAKKVLEISKEENNSNEVAITYSLDSQKLITENREYIGISLGEEHGVDPLNSTISYHLITSTKNCIIIVMHNHPSLSDFSLLDIKFFLKYESVKMMIVITNLGSITYIVKKNNYNYFKAVELLNESVNLNNSAKNLKDLQKAADYFLKNCDVAGINYDDR